MTGQDQDWRAESQRMAADLIAFVRGNTPDATGVGIECILAGLLWQWQRNAVLAERERCAKIADEQAEWWRATNAGPNADFADGEEEARRIARRIREDA